MYILDYQQKNSPDADSYITADIATVSGHFQQGSLLIVESDL